MNSDSCRACLTSGGDLFPIFIEDDNYFSAETSILNMFTSCTGLDININDLYPQYICYTCLEQLYSSYDFWQRCHNSYEKLKQVHHEDTVVVKEEKLDIIEVPVNEDYEEPYEEKPVVQPSPSNSSIYLIVTPCKPPSSKESQSKTDCDLKSNISADKSENKAININTESSANVRPNGVTKTNILNPKTTFGCTRCKIDFNTKDEYLEHSKKHGKILCQICGYMSPTSSMFRRHLNRHSNVRPYQCDLCEKNYKLSVELKRHKQIHKKEELFPCKQCDKKFIGTSALYYHQKKVHCEIDPHVCEVCNRGFKFRNSLTFHMMQHTGERPFPCTICPMAFTTTSGLRNHIYTHTGEKKFACTVCEKRFSRLYALKNHIVSHTGERNHSCDICGQKFAFRSGLVRHLNRHKNKKL